MKRKTLTTAVLAGLAGIAGIVSVSNAVHVNPDGTGQVLLYPYYTTRGENDTLISVVNTTDDVKAIKVRFLEGDNSREVLDFNLYMSPFDVWVASITEGDGGPEFRTSDNSCTVPWFFDPATGSGSFVFTNLLYDSISPDSGRDGIDRAREGYLELIEMGTVDPAGLGAFAVHDGSGGIDANGDPLPADCLELTNAWSVVSGVQGAWLVDPQTDMAPPTGGLFGDGIVINVPGARASGYDAVALDSFYVPDPAVDPVSLHQTPSSPEPDLADAVPATSSVVLSTGTTPPLVVTDTWAAGILAVSASLMVEQVMNQYATEAFINGGTEWVITYPTKKQHVWPVPVAIPPFTDTFDEPVQNQGDGEACEAVLVDFWDRNEQQTPPGSIIVPPSPAPPPDLGADIALCYEVNVVTFNNSNDSAGAAGNEANDIYTDILGSRLFVNFDFSSQEFESGWVQLTYNGTGVAGNPVVHELVNTASGNTYLGLPTVGFAVRSASNNSINALFGTGFMHKYTRVIQ